uniref:Evasin n=1 Tax=Rhipicephalus zambeziensis TaxID=60191 RepID=A0A224Y9L7_9ACAR
MAPKSKIMEPHVLIVAVLVFIPPISEIIAVNPSNKADVKLHGSNKGKPLPGEEGERSYLIKPGATVKSDCGECSCKLTWGSPANAGKQHCHVKVEFLCTCNGFHCSKKRTTNCMAVMADTTE